jgi:hypothetical protein
MRFLTLVLVLLSWTLTVPVSAQAPYRPWDRDRDYRWEHQRNYFPGEGRHEWVYSSATIRGRFVETGPRRWTEINPTGQWFYREVRRTPEYVEMFDRDRNLAVRLYDDRLYQLPVYAYEWQPIYWGHWR